MRACENDHVLYILGAGFSAQFGLPVMSNFLEKSKDIEENLFGYFKNIYFEIDKLRRCKDFYDADMTNIEEILSLFEMEKILGSESKQQLDFKQFISDVISYYTPEDKNIPNKKEFQSFLKNLFRLQSNSVKSSNGPFYSILTFNYDMLFEKLQKYLFPIWSFSNDKDDTDISLPYIKLHGSVEKPETIVPPTWHKLQKDIDNKWSIAGSLLKNANHIRIIGYSLPITDSYLKYFLKWGAAHEENLKSIDVICLDDEKKTVEKRYSDFIHHKLCFYNKSTLEYLLEVKNGIETAHEHLFCHK